MSSRLDVDRIKKDFPILGRSIRDGKRLVYLDSGATSQKPTAVLDAERHYYENSNAAAHRGAHQLAEESTEAYESARAKIAKFVGGAPDEIVFTKNATESLNLASYTFLNATLKAAQNQSLPDGAERFILKPGDEVVVSEMEHHANLVPWQELCAKTGATLRWFGVTDDGRLDYSNLDELINERTKVVSLVHQSNILGTVNQLDVPFQRAREVGALCVVDACQSIPHLPFDVHKTGADLVAWSGHKMLAPTGIGVLWGRREILEAMPPFLTGGSMIEVVTMEKTTFAKPPQRFEAGVPMMAQAVGLGAAVDFLDDLGMDAIAAHEHELTQYALAALKDIKGLHLIGPESDVDRGATFSFGLEEIHPHDVGQVLDDLGIAVRVGHHCAWPVCRRYQVQATVRASMYLYNDTADIDALVEGIHQTQKYFGVL